MHESAIPIRSEAQADRSKQREPTLFAEFDDAVEHEAEPVSVAAEEAEEPSCLSLVDDAENGASELIDAKRQAEAVDSDVAGADEPPRLRLADGGATMPDPRASDEDPADANTGTVEAGEAPVRDDAKPCSVTGEPMPALPRRGEIAGLAVPDHRAAPKRIGSGRLVPARLTWKPGDPFAGSQKTRGKPFRWEVMLTAACVTAACGMGCIWLLRTILA